MKVKEVEIEGVEEKYKKRKIVGKGREGIEKKLEDLRIEEGRVKRIGRN